ncbi:hypothetical protein [Kitasatospora sp. MBT63]|uniref:hypothetical protein n=1 Tax=Kitasatospora sp. MBT63 TaxID=1444768 RepID=UPI000539AC53|nr:hypothetical protein [Kitasatospora sp. MBT63]
MSYDFHITRAQDWTKSPANAIDTHEWEEAATQCPLIEEGEPWESTDLGLERTFNVPGETAVFAWWRGRIDIKGYYSDRTEEAAEALAKALGAHVLGDDG